MKKHGFFHSFFVVISIFLYFCSMITLGEMQISGMLTMLMLSVMLMACVPDRSIRRGSFARARWMIAAGTGLIAVQFLLQYIFGFREMGVPQRQLQEWLRQSEYGKRVLKEHPDWSTESVANYCGFSSREYFHRTFCQMTGMTPANFQ